MVAQVRHTGFQMQDSFIISDVDCAAGKSVLFQDFGKLPRTLIVGAARQTDIKMIPDLTYISAFNCPRRFDPFNLFPVDGG